MTINPLPIIREHKMRIPWGYQESEPGSLALLPIAKNWEAVNASIKYLNDGASFAKVCQWIEQQCGQSISPPTLTKIYESDLDNEEGRKRREKLVENYSANNMSRKYKRKDEETRLALGIGQIKKKLTAKQKRLERLREAKTNVPKEVLVGTNTSASKSDLANEQVRENEVELAEPTPIQHVEPVVFKPNPGPQTEFLAASEFCVLFGGAAGPGKSWALVVDPLRTVHLPSHKAITFRKTIDQLRELIAESKKIYPQVIPGAKFLEQKSTWIFPNGGTHWYRYLDRDTDVEDLQGQQFTWAGFDELTHWATPFVFDYVRSRVRSSDPEIKPYCCVRATSNPGSIGHNWVKKAFIDPAPPNTTFPVIDIETGLVKRYPEGHHSGKGGEPLYYCRFIPGKLSDNPHLFNDGGYEASLLSLPEVQRRQLLDGDWDIIEGAAFSEFRRDLHVCKPFDIPSHWIRFRACDWGFEQHHAVLWFAQDPTRNILYVYRERYGRRTISSDLADKILVDEQGENISYGVLDSHAWDVRDGGTSPAVTMIGRGCRWRPAANRAPNSRTTTKQELHRRLSVYPSVDENTGNAITATSLVIFDNCINLIRTLPTIQVDKTNPEDVDTDGEDHLYDALRYGCASKPMYRTAPRSSFSSFNAAPQKQYNAFGFPV